MTATAIASASRAASPTALLAGLRADRATADAAEARILAAAVAWAELHPAGSDAAVHWEHGVGIPIAGEGTPLVAEWCIAEFAAALGLSTDAGRQLLGHALELSHRLPRLWARIQAGDLTAWRARRIRDHVIARDPTCVFPHCTRNARRCDLDHITPYGPHGGPTATDNLAPLCRRHHRLKTHAGWTYTMVEPGTYLWRSPHGLAYQRDHTGTLALNPIPPRPRPPDQ